MKTGKTISPGQLDLLLWAGLLAPVTELFPAALLPGAGGNAWLAVLLGGLCALGTALTWGGLSARGGAAAAIRTRLGRRSGGVLLSLYMAWFLLLLSLRLALCAHRLLQAGERDGTPLFFLLLLTLLLLRLSRDPLPAFARAAQLFLAMLLTAGGAVLLLSLPAVRTERLTPVGLPPLSSVITAAGAFSWALPAAFLPRSPQRRSGWYLSRLTALLLLTGAQLILLGNLGENLAARVELPFFYLSRSVAVEGAFQRVESVITALWLLADLSMGGILLHALGQGWRQLRGREPGRGYYGAVLALSALGALVLLGTDGALPELSQRLVPAIGLALSLALPVLMSVLCRTRES